jgi:membrane protease YdiL (CAAX protease family)
LLSFSTHRLLETIAFELVLGLLLLVGSRRRHWRLSHVTLPFQPKDLVRAFGVFVYGYLLYAAAWLLALLLAPGIADSVAAMKVTGGADATTVVAVSLINPVYEEFVWLAFAVNGPSRRRLVAALGWSLLPRLLVHLYQGPLALISILPLGAWYLWYYARTGRIWPIVLAHAAQDLIGLLTIGGAGNG